MTVKPELLATAASMAELVRLADAGADAFVLGESRFGMRLAGEFNLEQLAEAVQYASPRSIKIYAAVNNLIDNETVTLLPEYIKGLAHAGVNAVIFGDPAVLMAVREHAPQLQLHWNTEMTSTNYATANYWGRKGAGRFVLARELNLDEVLDIKRHTSLEVQVQVHGMTNIYHSKRSLVNSYMDYRCNDGGAAGSSLVTDKDSGLYLIEVERQEERYPIYEDRNGTHIMSSDDVCMLESLHELMEAGVDSFKIEGLLKSTTYNEIVVRAYRKVIDAYFANPESYQFDEQILEEIRAVQDSTRELSFGFFYKEQVY
ncbi:peptidase U32 family protein [Paenibacillus sp. GCM10012307]|uniref:U32 family peptidase n=1 Tax=Paenibacillus roseus TaxID=2798579 RepID=A0A934J1C1_9BACL|nr:peptidase U32 family protein [Paenibacillus roseus]MBJ6363001.1 U32 family peptidase [Paenibacillus roseus]